MLKILPVLSISVVACALFVNASLSYGQTLAKERRIGPFYVALDSWVYPAIRRLAAMGYTPDLDNLVGPWSRQQCLMLVQEADDIASRRATKLAAGSAEAARLIAELEAEFGRDQEPETEVRIESVYTRLAGIGGAPLQDSYHFGQTVVNDFGRPFGRGANTIAGVSGYGSAGRFSAYFRGEYQDAPAPPAYSPSLQNVIEAIDGIPTAPHNGVGLPRFDPLEAYLGVALGPFDITAGKQSLWWGPGEASAFHFSNNAEPFYSLRLRQRAPLLLPGPFRLLGRIRTEFVFGRLSGHEYPPGPLINAQKITFQLTKDFELGFTRSAIFAGAGHPLTVGSFAASLFSFSSSGGTAFGSGNDPGDRRSGFDFEWHLPKLRHLVTIYSDSLADDEPSPLANPKRSAWAPGLYLSRIPGIGKMDFRFETYSTWLYQKDEGGGFIYWNDQYRDAYTDDGFLLGSWIGRDARAYVASSTYWKSPRLTLTASYKQTKIGSNFLNGGGTQTDFGLGANWRIRPDILVTTNVQGERYFIPVIGGPHRDVLASVQVTYFPARWAAHR